MSVYEMIVDTIFVCFCEDLETNYGMTRPYFMSSGLMKAMRKMQDAAVGESNFEAAAPMMIETSWHSSSYGTAQECDQNKSL
jgi:hypothetical protein